MLSDRRKICTAALKELILFYSGNTILQSLQQKYSISLFVTSLTLALAEEASQTTVKQVWLFKIHKIQSDPATIF